MLYLYLSGQFRHGNQRKSIMTKETEKLIRTEVRKHLKACGYTEYMIRKVIKSELANPTTWATYPDGDNSEEAKIWRYYSHINTMSCTNIVLDFRNRNNVLNLNR